MKKATIVFLALFNIWVPLTAQKDAGLGIHHTPDETEIAGCMEIIVEHYLSCNMLSFFTPADDAVVEWHFGDGTVVVDGPDVLYTYSEEGTYTVTAYVTAPGCPEGLVITLEVYIDCGNSVDEAGNSYFTLYPNPSDGNTTLVRQEAGTEEMMIFDVSGSLVHREFISSPVHRVSLHELKQGAYFIRVGNASKRLTIVR
jgi:hypothetical protein